MEGTSSASRGGAMSTGEVREQLWVLRAQLGDLESLTQLVGAHQLRVLHYLESIVGSREDAEDALQEIWVTVVRKIAKLEDPRAFRAWLYRIARNRAVSILRKSRREKSLLADAAAAPDEGTLDQDEGDLSWTEAYDPETLRAAIAELSPAHREAIVLRYFQGMEYEEISEIASCNIGTVRSRIHYAKKALRVRLTEPRTSTLNREEHP